ncbi:unnamed protein product, partial [Prorocentrum cordatum]
WVKGADWQLRILLTPCSESDFESAMETEPPAGANRAGQLRFAITPDGDAHPHALTAPGLSGAAALDDENHIIQESAAGAVLRKIAKVHGHDWQPSPMELFAALEVARVSPQPSPDGGSRSSGARPGARRRLAGEQPIVSGATQTGSIDAGYEHQPDAAPNVWIVKGPSGNASVHTIIGNAAVDEHAAIAGFAAARQGDEVLLLKEGAAAEANADLDARALSVETAADGERRRNFRESAELLTESHWDGWPIRGPRTTAWRAQFIAEQDQHPRSRHAKWRHERGLGASDTGVGVHELAMRFLEISACFDQLNITELACVELLMRKVQLAEWRHRERLTSRAGSDDLLEDEFLYLGTGETRGLIMVAPGLQGHISQELRRECATAKERRRVRAERMAARPPGGRASGGAAGASGTTELEKKAARQAEEIRRLQAVEGGRGAAIPAAELGGVPRSVRSRLRRRGHVHTLAGDVVDTLNSLCGLCGARPGYVQEPEQRATYQEGNVALPDLGDAPSIRPCSDPALVSDPVAYAKFVGDPVDAGAAACGPKGPHTVGIFLVRKTSGQLRPIIDARLVNSRFVDPHHTVLATQGSWQSLETPEGGLLHVAQLDVDSAFYRIDLPPGLDQYLLLPAALFSAFEKVRPDLAKLIDPACHSLYFCQELVTGAVLASGFGAEQWVRGRHSTSPIAEVNAAAVHVDGVAVVGASTDVNADCEKVEWALTARDLLCKGVVAAGPDQKFSGLVFDAESGIASLPRERMWKTRLALIEAASAPYLTGKQGRSSGSSATAPGGALLRRELLAVFQLGHIFAREAGPPRWRAWSGVRRELLDAANLILFAFMDSRRPFSDRALATDASRGGSVAGAFGAAERTVTRSAARDVMAQAERWRYATEDMITARQHALQKTDVSPIIPPVSSITDFSSVSFDFVGMK